MILRSLGYSRMLAVCPLFSTINTLIWFLMHVERNMKEENRMARLISGVERV